MPGVSAIPGQTGLRAMRTFDGGNHCAQGAASCYSTEHAGMQCSSRVQTYRKKPRRHKRRRR